MTESSSKNIRESIDSIEPAAGAKERMLSNIRQKASAQPPQEKGKTGEPDGKKVLSFNRIARWALPIAAGFVIAVIGVTNMQKINNPAGTDPASELLIPNPFVSVDDAAELERILGIKADAPEGAENVGYSIIDNELADIVFSYEGHEYNLRASTLGGDFSGLSGIEAKKEQVDAGNAAVLALIRSGSELYAKLTWTDGKVTYILSNTDGASEDDMKALYGKVK